MSDFTVPAHDQRMTLHVIALCVNHHRTHFGIHMLPAPLWEPLRYRKSGVAAGGEFVAAKDWKP